MFFLSGLNMPFLGWVLSSPDCFTWAFFTGFRESPSTALGGPSLVLVFVKLHSKLSQGTGLKRQNQKEDKNKGYGARYICPLCGIQVTGGRGEELPLSLNNNCCSLRNPSLRVQPFSDGTVSLVVLEHKFPDLGLLKWPGAELLHSWRPDQTEHHDRSAGGHCCSAHQQQLSLKGSQSHF